MDSNAAGSSRNGASDDKIAQVNDYMESDLYDEAERAAMQLADAMTATPPNVTDELFAHLQRFYDEPQLVELLSIIAQENSRARRNTTFRIPSAGSYCPLPPPS